MSVVGTPYHAYKENQSFPKLGSFKKFSLYSCLNLFIYLFNTYLLSAYYILSE